jgi:hypothetical protein
MSKATATKKAKPVSRPLVKGKSRKSVVFLAWQKSPDATVEQLLAKVDGIQESTVRSWRAEWRQGWGFPKGYGPTTKPETKRKKSAKKSK